MDCSSLYTANTVFQTWKQSCNFAKYDMTTADSGLVGDMRRMGFPSPWVEKPSSPITRALYRINDIYVVTNNIYILFAYLYTILGGVTFTELCALGIGLVGYPCSLLLTVYQLANHGRLKHITDTADSICQEVIDSKLGHEQLFSRIYKENNQRLARVLIYLPFFTMTMYSLPVPVMDWFSGEYRTRLPLPIRSPFDDKLLGVYEIVMFMQVTSINSTCRKTANDSLFVAIFKCHTAMLKYLAIAMDSIKEDFIKTGDHDRYRTKMVKWIKLHQAVLGNIQELLELFSPVVVITFINAVGIVVCGLFVQLKKDSDNMVQSMGMGFFVVMAISLLLILTNAAEELVSEGKKLAFSAYDLPWYKMKKRDAEMIKLIINRSNRPMLVTAYKTTTFLISRETFAGFMTSSLSAFVTLCQMKDRID